MRNAERTTHMSNTTYDADKGAPVEVSADTDLVIQLGKITVTL